MKLNTTRLLIILVVLVGVFAIVKLTQNTGRSSSFKTELVNFEPDLATQIKIKSPGQEVELKKNGDTWQVETAQGTKTALEGNVSTLLSTLNTIQPSRLAGRDPSKWKDFSVDSSGTQIQVYGGNELLSDIIIGRFGVEGQRSFYTYVRLADDEDVYVADNFMKMSISTSPNDFRNNILARVNKDSLTAIAFNYPDSAVILNKQEGRWMKGMMAADSAATAKYLNNLSIVSSKNFSTPSTLLNPEMNVTFSLSSGKEIQISAYREEEQWIFTSSENTEEAWHDPALLNKLFVASSQF